MISRSISGGLRPDGAADIVDSDIDTAKSFTCIGHEHARAFCRFEIGKADTRRSAGRPDFFHDAPCLFFRPIGDHHPAAFSGQSQCRGAPNTLGGASHDADFPVKSLC